jgi:hypothetical protein
MITDVSQDFDLDSDVVATIKNQTNSGAACTDLGTVLPLASGGLQAIFTPSPTQTATAPHSVSASHDNGSVHFDTLPGSGPKRMLGTHRNFQG